jgi:hypothetical protein
MSDVPDAAELLAIARTTLLDKLLPQLPAESRYDALMVANAMAIAARELAAADTAARAELARAVALLGEPVAEGASDTLNAARAKYRRRLAMAIRAGRFDERDHAALLAHLAQSAADELAVSNPRALET